MSVGGREGKEGKESTELCNCNNTDDDDPLVRPAETMMKMYCIDPYTRTRKFNF